MRLNQSVPGKGGRNGGLRENRGPGHSGLVGIVKTEMGSPGKA